jgi:hypothetical protein
MDLAPLRFGCIQLGPIAQLSRAKILSNRSDAFFDVSPVQLKGPAIISNSPKGHMDVRVFGVMVGHRRPLELRSEVLFQSRHKVACEPLQIDPLPELWGYDEFPEQRIPRRLPLLQASTDVNSLFRLVEADRLRIPFVCGALSRQIPSVRPP